MISAIIQSVEFSTALKYYKLTPREVEVFMLMIEGDTLDQIAEKLLITSSTTQTHIKNMIERTESKNRTELIVKVIGYKVLT